MAIAESRITRYKLDDPKTQAALEEHTRAVGDLYRDPMMRRRTFMVTLPDATAVTISHGLGRTFEAYSLGAPIGATTTGRIVETAGNPASNIILTATGHGATITVRMTVW